MGGQSVPRDRDRLGARPLHEDGLADGSESPRGPRRELGRAAERQPLWAVLGCARSQRKWLLQLGWKSDRRGPDRAASANCPARSARRLGRAAWRGQPDALSIRTSDGACRTVGHVGRTSRTGRRGRVLWSAALLAAARPVERGAGRAPGRRSAGPWRPADRERAHRAALGQAGGARDPARRAWWAGG